MNDEVVLLQNYDCMKVSLLCYNGHVILVSHCEVVLGRRA